MATTKLFVGNITRGSSPEELRREFAQYGNVVECDIISDYGFVHFSDGGEADTALQALHGAMFNGQKLKVEKSTSYVRKKPGDGNLSSEVCYVCNRTGHWAKNCPQVPEEERDRQNRRAERSRGRGRGRGGRDRDDRPPPRRPRDYYDDYDDGYDPPPRRRRPPPDYYDDYDDYDYYPRRRPPPRYYDPYDDYPPPRRLPPPSYYRERDPYPPRRRDPYDDYPPPRPLPMERLPVDRLGERAGLAERAALAERPTLAPSAATPNPAPPVYYDFAEDSVDQAVRAAARDIDPLAASKPQAKGGPTEDMLSQTPGAAAAERFNGASAYPAAAAEPRFAALGPDRSSMMDSYYRRPRPY